MTEFHWNLACASVSRGQHTDAQDVLFSVATSTASISADCAMGMRPVVCLALLSMVCSNRSMRSDDFDVPVPGWKTGCESHFCFLTVLTASGMLRCLCFLVVTCPWCDYHRILFCTSNSCIGGVLHTANAFHITIGWAAYASEAPHE